MSLKIKVNPDFKNLFDKFTKMNELSKKVLNLGDRRSGYFVVNIKLHHLKPLDLDSIFTELKVTEEEKKHLSNYDNFYEHFLEDSNQYLLDILRCCRVSSKKWWDENVLPKLKNGERTGYPFIDDELDYAEKIKKYNKIVEEDDLEYTNLSQIDVKNDVYNFGRSGGWLSLKKMSFFENIQNAYEDFCELFKFDDKKECITIDVDELIDDSEDETIRDTFYHEFRYDVDEKIKTLIALEYACGVVETFIKSLDYNDYVKNDIDYLLPDIRKSIQFEKEKSDFVNYCKQFNLVCFDSPTPQSSQLSIWSRNLLTVDEKTLKSLIISAVKYGVNLFIPIS